MPHPSRGAVEALTWAGVHVGIGAARKMGKGRFTLTPL
jgi:hypothetical protein